VVDHGGRLMFDRVEQRLDQMLGAGAVAASYAEAAEVDERLERKFRRLRVKRPGGLEDAELGPAQTGSQCWQAAVAGDQRGEIVCFRRARQGFAQREGGGFRKFDNLANTNVETMTDGSVARN
jgi:hypothetical protein